LILFIDWNEGSLSMTKKRVHELAKELGVESKELITHLEKIGITVKSHSSTLEENDVERIKKELLAKEPKHIVEERIKSTVIRRRAVRAAVEEAPAEEIIEEKKEVKVEVKAPAEVREKKEPPHEAEIVDVKKKEGPPVEQVLEINKEEQPKPSTVDVAEAVAHVQKEAPRPEEKQEKVETKAIPVEEKPAEVRPKPQIIPVRPPIISKPKISKPEPKKEIQPKAPVKPAEKPSAPPMEKILKKEFEKPRKKGKVPVEVFIEEEKEAPRRKVLEKKIEKKLRKHDDDHEVVFAKWREEKKIAPVKMKKNGNNRAQGYQAAN